MQLIVAEKPSVAQSIASVVGATQKRNGHREGNGYIISWCSGHLLELAAPDVYNEKLLKWRYGDLPIIPDKWLYSPLKGKESQLKVLKELMNRSDVDCVINACDAGREGELIFRLVYEHANCTKPIKRLWISSMEETAIKAGINAIKDGAQYDSLYAAASCRERADWLVGLNHTRLFTAIYGTLLKVGRVQSPTLALLVKRDADIATFVKEPFYTVELNCNGLVFSSEKFKDKGIADKIYADCVGQSAVIKKIAQQEKSIAPPKLFDLTTLQREANRAYGYTAKEVLDYTQSLYEKRMVSYPRTNSRYLTEDVAESIPALVEVAGEIVPLAEIGAVNVNQVIDSSRVSDHHAIIPTMTIRESLLSTLPTGEKNILKMIAKRLIEAVGDKHVYAETTVILELDNVSDESSTDNCFKTKGKTVIQMGWKSGTDSEKALPDLIEGQIFNNVTASIKEGATMPPKAYTEDTLLAAMEKAGAEDADPEVAQGLGTPATRAATIEKIIASGFATRQKKNIIPTDKGKCLISVLPEALTSPKLTAEWEHKLYLVEKGEMSEFDFMSGISDFVKQIVSENNAPKPGLEGLFGNGKTDKPPLGSCPRCKNSIREAARGFFCDNQTCGFKLFKQSKFWTAKKKVLTAEIVAALLKEGRVTLKNLYSEKSGKEYDATILLDDTGNGYVGYKMEFSGGRSK